ncbi:Por secretion system C-terminal sorting domain-containing protein [Flaviramulus basaltis]|uniref:Por secretion system C-terminal sorting domain-containing protein n=1 Tax=Flaviramulus basaltis TaxID=369401 RepID=A0A1K2IQV0_9FLAO|nr:T9SS type A sorting domain-containing protein [Flaviramulus basaltis]SFZ94091.1 Por secretion system C-terminal sorting domain-containing protein [Flaviramulus basaltis]
MKTKKLLFLSTMLMVFSVTAVMAQRGTCTSGADPLQYMYTIVDGTETQDTSTALAGTINDVSPGAEVRVGSAYPYINWQEVTSFSIDVSSDNGEPSITIDNSNIGDYGQNWQPTIPPAFFTSGAVTTVALTLTPDASNPHNGCTTPWTYTWTFNTGSVCVPSNHNAYSNTGAWFDHPAGLTTIDFYNVPIGTDIALGVDNPKSTIVYNGCGFSETVESADFWFTPFTEAGTCTITGVYTNNCGDDVTYTFNLSTSADPLGTEKFEQAGFSMYPNPAKDILNINFNRDLDAVILNTSGQKIMSRSINGQEAIDISNLSSGLYFVKLVADKNVITRKFIKE